jgi:hypothetical protein
MSNELTGLIIAIVLLVLALADPAEGEDTRLSQRLGLSAALVLLLVLVLLLMV